ncbi:hypothetical protein Daura_45870 [Dactylosporangium aurantiacum]|uniref:Uncharacterized protein n=1 Tax=Dactylosporangium aurantiacum TaxID=35754 RepID=A0A9Q9II23_9ACTN|nr:hypothetical protein [Dactylosporangium aurantiacum]MDG6108136.1 hypothetical protein [Dactylosporangium aurantiacum]UWZ53764.1 hypothetical protein Daura_45870 [Dactylosporangium aurantiacum]
MVDLPGISDDAFEASDDDDSRGDGSGSSINVKKVAIVCGALAGVALLGSAVVYGPTILRVSQQSDTTVSTPPQVGPFTLFSTDDATQTAEYVRDAVVTQVSLDKSVGAIYRDQNGPSEVRTVILVAGTGRIWKPERSLEAAFKAVAGPDPGDAGIRDVHDVDAGELGGVARCGEIVDKDGSMAVCGWADNGSLGVALFPGRQMTDAEKALLQLRPAVEKR